MAYLLTDKAISNNLKPGQYNPWDLYGFIVSIYVPVINTFINIPMGKKKQ